MATSPADPILAAYAQHPFADTILHERWKAKLDEGVFRSPFEGTQSKPLSTRFTLQFNAAQASGKRCEHPKDSAVVQAFDDKRFNFNKVREGEVLGSVGLERRADGWPCLRTIWAGACDAVGAAATSAADAGVIGGGNSCAPPPSKLIVNVSPLTPGHFILAPFTALQLPQVLTADALLLGLVLVQSSRRFDFRVVFNSLGAWASVNHLHLHGVYLDGVTRSGAFPAELAARRALVPGGHRIGQKWVLHVEETIDYPSPAIVLRLTRTSVAGGADGADGSDDVAAGPSLILRSAFAVVRELQQRDVPHNIVCGKSDFALPFRYEVFVFPRRAGVPGLDGALGVAVMEIAGHPVVRSNQSAFDAMTGEAYERHVMDEVALPNADYDTLKVHLLRAIQVEMQQ
eukprot:g1893.t1